MLKLNHGKTSEIILRFTAATVLLVAASSLGGQQAPVEATDPAQSPPRYDFVKFRDVMVPMRDGGQH